MISISLSQAPAQNSKEQSGERGLETLLSEPCFLLNGTQNHLPHCFGYNVFWPNLSVLSDNRHSPALAFLTPPFFYSPFKLVAKIKLECSPVFLYFFYYHYNFCCRLDIEQCGDCGCDSLTFAFNDSSYRPPWDSRGNWQEDKECGRLTSGYLEFAHMMDGDPNKRFSTKELYVRFSSDDSVNYKGFNFTFVAKTDSCKLQFSFYISLQ